MSPPQAPEWSTGGVGELNGKGSPVAGEAGTGRGVCGGIGGWVRGDGLGMAGAHPLVDPEAELVPQRSQSPIKSGPESRITADSRTDRLPDASLSGCWKVALSWGINSG